jgi:hypothetical protein
MDLITYIHLDRRRVLLDETLALPIWSGTRRRIAASPGIPPMPPTVISSLTSPTFLARTRSVTDRPLAQRPYLDWLMTAPIAEPIDHHSDERSRDLAMIAPPPYAINACPDACRLWGGQETHVVRSARSGNGTSSLQINHTHTKQAVPLHGPIPASPRAQWPCFKV